ncbi:MAG: hypothetical protein AAB731_01115 [Patescibacteria group bacterium]
METKLLIKDLEVKRGSKVITYFTSDRQGPVNARVAMDIIPVISNQLRLMGKTDKIDLFLYSAGGDTMVPWRLVSMIREYCDHFSVLVPYKAHSAATMIAGMTLNNLLSTQKATPIYYAWGKKDKGWVPKLSFREVLEIEKQRVKDKKSFWS